MADHAFDPQAAAFRSASPEDWVGDDLMSEMLSRGELRDSTSDPVVPVESYEAARWDAGRHPAGPKTVEEARALLQARVEDPGFPERDATLYDGLEQG